MVLTTIRFNNKTKHIDLETDLNKTRSSCIVDIRNNIFKTFDIELDSTDHFFMINKSKPLTYNNFVLLSKNKQIEIDVYKRLNGGIIDAIIDVLENMVKMFKGLGTLIYNFFEIMYYIFEMIPIIFDPPKLVDDILFALTNSISTVMDYFMKSTDAEKPKEEPSESGPFGVNKRDNNKTCIPPTMATLIMLVLCPPLSIFYKFSFWEGIIPAIVCGVLCVKLYYFPGLLFASLMVLC